jgi:hypothetical protein
VEIRVTGGDAVEGLNLRVQVADGGTHPQAGGTVDGPKITGVDLITDTIFAGNTTGQGDLLRLPQIWVQTTTTASGSAVADGLLARLTLDTTGFFEGSFGLSLGDTKDGPTDFAGVPIDISDGSLTVVVPEPGSWALCIGGIVGLIVARLSQGQRNRRPLL